MAHLKPVNAMEPEKTTIARVRAAIQRICGIDLTNKSNDDPIIDDADYNPGCNPSIQRLWDGVASEFPGVFLSALDVHLARTPRQIAMLIDARIGRTARGGDHGQR